MSVCSWPVRAASTGVLSLSVLAGAVVARQLPATPAEPQSALAAAAKAPDFFEARVRPILAANCYDCHTDEEKGGLRLDSREAFRDSAYVE